ncbi:hypothetical protein V496_07326 [Pseudogymnoascus sp. VKM F-4515 (FW-2607)]|nr:hypothetical protein V496_07326 [Pseudogymnoascus sp. VKM F-4515 (FW-2607)]KFY98282.1 hypothetical protein V498_01547 [Pseudogymnoascus sp. VKM F-4517 (FW-2822)]
MPIFSGSCYCGEIKYTIDLTSPNKARSSICHCRNCKKFCGSAFAITTKIPRESFMITQGSPKEHVGDNGSGVQLHREFCDECGSGILEYAEPATEYTYIMYGTLDEPNELPPKGEFFCSRREKWMPEIPGIFHKQIIKE